MKRYVEYEIDGGKPIIVEIEDVTPGLVPAADSGQVVAKSRQGFEQAMETIGPVAEKLVTRLSEMAKAPDQIGVEFGLKLGFAAGAVIASGSTEANFKVSLTWKRESVSR